MRRTPDDAGSEEQQNLLPAADHSTPSSAGSDLKSVASMPTRSTSTRTASDRSKLLKETKSETGEDDKTGGKKREGEEEEWEPVTNWRAIITCAVVYFFITTILQALNVVAYMYLKKIDPTISPVFAGLHMASTKIGHALGTIIFAVYAYSFKSFKKPLLIGRVVSLLSLVLYLLIMIFPVDGRRYVFLTAFFGQSIAEGSMIVVRSFVPRVSSRKDRQAAYGVINGAMMMSILAGPGIQLSVGNIPTAKLFEWLEFNSFTYCIWIALMFCLIATVIICVFMTEPAPISESSSSRSEVSFRVTMAKALAQLAEMDKVALGFLFFEKIVASVCFSALLSAFTAFMSTILNKEKGVTMLYVAGSQAAVGITSILTVLVFIFTPLGKCRASPILFFALACYFLMYLYSYPWPPISQPIVTKDPINGTATNANGCDATELEWCASQSHVKVWYWLPVVVPLFGMAVPTSMISMDTVYSKLLGNIDQNLMQGALVLVDDLASSIAPIVTMKLYTAYGPAAFWLVLAGNALVGFLAWLPMIPKMRRLKM